MATAIDRCGSLDGSGRRRAGIALLLALASAPLFAQKGNLVASGRFDVAADEDDWASSHVDGTYEWTSEEDADNCGGSGALRVATTLEDTSVTYQTCVVSGVAENALHRLSVAFRYESDEVVGRAQIEATYHEGLGCAGEAGATFIAGEPNPLVAGWQRFEAFGQSDPGTGSAEIRVVILKDSPDDLELVMFFDEVFLGLDEVLLAEDHEIGSHCRWPESNVPVVQ